MINSERKGGSRSRRYESAYRFGLDDAHETTGTSAATYAIVGYGSRFIGSGY